jgi:hypothetical protein
MARPVRSRALSVQVECRSGTGTDKPLTSSPISPAALLAQRFALYPWEYRATVTDRMNTVAFVWVVGMWSYETTTISRVPSLSSLTRCIRHRDG